MERILFILTIFIFIALIVAFPLMWLWNWLMPVIFGLPEITILQSLGLFVLSGLLFKGGDLSKR